MAKKDIENFIHLRVHSSYSLSEGAITPQALVELCQKHAMPAVAVTDSGNLFGSLEFSMACAKGGVQPIIGCVMAIDIQADANNPHAQRSFSKIVLLAKDDAGYHNLLKLVSYSFLEAEDASAPHITLTQLEKYHEGLILLTGGPEGPIGTLLLAKQKQKAEQLLRQLKETFGDRLYIELMRHGLESEKLVEPDFIDFAYEHDIPLVATNEAYFASREMHEAHDALLCIAQGSYVTEENRRKVTPEHFFKTARQMKELFADIPEALANTQVIAKRCAVMSECCDPMLPHYPCEEGRTEADELRNVAEKGLEKRLADHVFTAEMSADEKEAKRKEYVERLNYELGVIIEMKFPGYFLIVSDFIRWGKRQGIPIGPGRGSGAGSMVAWSLEITDLDPLRFGLLFERFLNPERVSMPDFDIDFCQERREEVIRYVQQKYGHNKVAQIITFGKLQARAVLRDVGRVLQLPYSQVDRISKMIPFNPIDPVTLEKALKMDRELRKMRDEDNEVKKLIGIGMKLEGLNRHASTHAAGLVIADRPLEELVPVYRDPRSDMPVSGYSMKYTEAAGLVKFDFLGLKTLTVIAKTCQFIRQTVGRDIDISKIPIDDVKTFEMLTKGDSVGVFQLESAGMRDTLRKLRPDNIDDIIALISLYRPGPMDNIPSYIARKHGSEEPDYLDPMLKEVLDETYGVIIYQEQVMQIAQIMGGYSLGGADLLRRAMGKKIAAEMDAQRKIFVDGALKNNVDKSKASSIFDLVAKFAGYGFNKSHAAAYAMISYQTAYLKANYPVEFLAASMNLDISDTDKIATFRQDMAELGIQMLLPDINRSDAGFKPEKLPDSEELAIRYGLGALKNVGVTAMESMVKERQENGSYTGIFEFAARQENAVLNKRQLEGLTRAGAFDALHNNRRQLFENVELITRYGQHAAQERSSNQSSLFGNTKESQGAVPTMRKVDDWQGTERLSHEFAAIGLYLSSHPISAYEATLKRMNVLMTADFNTKLSDGSSSVKIAGVVTAKRIRSSAKGRFATLALSDPTGMFEVSVFDEDLLSEARELLENGSILYIEAQARKDEGGVRIIAESIRALEEIVMQQKFSIEVFLQDTVALARLQQSLGQPGQGKARVTVVMEVGGKQVKITLPETYPLSFNAIEDIKELEGVKEVAEA